MVLLYISIPIMILALAIATVPLIVTMRREAFQGDPAHTTGGTGGTGGAGGTGAAGDRAGEEAGDRAGEEAGDREVVWHAA